MTVEQRHIAPRASKGETELRAWLVRTLPQWSRQDATDLSAQLFAFLAGATHDGIVVEDPKRNVTYVNPRLASWVGLGNTLPDHLTLDGCLSGAIPDTLDTRDAHVAGPEGHLFRVDWQTRHGKRLTLDMRFVPFHDAEGRYAGGMGLLRPVRQHTPAPAAVPQVLESNDTPERDPGSGSGIGHDFNNMMAVVISNSELLQKRLGDNVAAERILGNVLDAGRQAGRLARRIVNQARRGTTTRQLLNLNELIRELAEFEHYITTQYLRVEINTAAQLWHLCGDPAQLERLIVSLATNAAEAMPTGGVLSVHTSNVLQNEERVLYSGTLRPGRYVLLEVCDTGCGIPSASVGRIFEPYYSTKNSERGTGLATVIQIVREHGGALAFTTQDGQGSRFSVFLPTTAPAESAAEVASSVRHEVVVFGQDVTLTSTTKRMLARLGYYPTVLQHADEVAAYCTKRTPDACVLLLPSRMSATEQCDHVHKMKREMPKARLLVIGATTDPATADDVLGAGADSHLTVPFRLQDIAAKLGSVLELGRLE